MHRMVAALFAPVASAAVLMVAAPASAQNFCVKAGFDEACCAQVCAINPLCCDIAWDAACEKLLAGVNCVCAGAIPMPGDSVSIDTTAATRDFNMSGLCDPGPYGDDTIHNYIVFSWVAPESRRYTLSTCDIADYDTRLAVLNSCDGGTVVACNDDQIGTCANFTSRLTFESESGVLYYFLVGGYSEADVGTGTMTIAPFAAELTLRGAHTYAVSDGANGRTFAHFAVNAGSRWTEIAAKAVEMGGTLASPNDALESLAAGSVVRAAGGGAIIAFGLSQDLSDPNLVEPAGSWKWADGTSPSYTRWINGEPNNFGELEHYGQFSAVYFGEFWNDNSDAQAWTHAIVEFPPEANFAGAAPANDEPAGAEAISAGQLVTVSLLGATTSAQSVGCEDPMHYDRWYRFTPATSDDYEFVACGNGFTGTVAVYTPKFGLVGCSGGACNFTLTLDTGVAYYLRVGSPDPWSAGNPTLVVQQAPDIVSLDAISVNFVGGTYLDGADGGRCNNTDTVPAGANEWGTLKWSNLVGANDAACAGYAAAGNGNAPAALRDGTGAATGASVAWSVNNPWRIFSFPSSDTDRMRRGYLDSNTLSEIVVTVSNVPYSNYTAVMYFGADGPDRIGTAAANDAAPIFFKTDATPSGVFNPLIRATAADQASAVRSSYAVFEGLSGPTCTMRLAEFGPNVGFMGFQIVAENAPCATDLTDDGATNAADLSILLGAWGTAGADLNGDGTTNAADLSILLGAWGACP
ncbi:MAG: hypothetical protein ACO3IB_00975 [Phycisphaerales bacterium]